jgi:predicted ribosomally synthesized peptide with SipW-like signal peptide
MNKKILLSLSVIGTVAAIAIGGTIAYFSDVEESTGNTFTAGTLDLLIDIDGVLLPSLNGPIFNLTDMKPGDNGEKTLSLHVDNDACGFVSISIDSDDDNSCTEPESLDDPEGPDCGALGELNDEVNWLIWRDEGLYEGWQCNIDDPVGPTAIPGEGCYDDPLEGNNIWDDTQYEIVLTEGSLTEMENWGFGGIKASDIQYYGFAWCFGEWNGMSCDGSIPKNEAQSDSFTATMTITAEQYRNQYGTIGDFPAGCPFGEPIQEPPVE